MQTVWACGANLLVTINFARLNFSVIPLILAVFDRFNLKFKEKILKYIKSFCTDLLFHRNNLKPSKEENVPSFRIY